MAVWNGEHLLTEESIFSLAVAEAGRRINSQLFARTRLERVQIGRDDEIMGIARYITGKLCQAPILDDEPDGFVRMDGWVESGDNSKSARHTRMARKKPHSLK